MCPSSAEKWTSVSPCGWVDELRLWGAARPAAAVAAQMNAALGGNEPGLIKYVPFSANNLPAAATAAEWSGPGLALSTAPITTFAVATTEAGAYTRPLFSSTWAVSDTQYTLCTPNTP